MFGFSKKQHGPGAPIGNKNATGSRGPRKPEERGMTKGILAGLSGPRNSYEKGIKFSFENLNETANKRFRKGATVGGALSFGTLGALPGAIAGSRTYMLGGGITGAIAGAGANYIGSRMGQRLGRQIKKRVGIGVITK